MPKIKFISNRGWLSEDASSAPGPTAKEIPAWYRKASRFEKKPSGEPYIGADGGKIPTWKACPAIYDIISTGYVYKTPCDIEFFIDEYGKISAKVLDPKYADFLQFRTKLNEFHQPSGYHENHFAWFSDWAVETPKGYSVLYSHPFNRFDLPFLTTNGIIDNDKVTLPGTIPFFINKEWTGVLPAGTPYAQMLPFKRENWVSEYILEPAMNIWKKNIANVQNFRVPNGGVYIKKVWERRKYD